MYIIKLFVNNNGTGDEEYGCKECVDEGVNGLKVPVGDAHALALAIRKLVDNPEMLTSMGKASRMKAEKEFDIVQVVNKHLEIYNQYL